MGKKYNLKVDFFKNINTKQKAYWLGAMFSDGCVYKFEDNYRTVFRVSKKDYKWVENFAQAIGKDPKKDYYYRNTVGLTVSNDEFSKNLINKGCVERKSLIIRFPDLATNELKLAFLLGYYDGDGFQGKTKICSGSLEFLKDVKNIFKIGCNIKKKAESNCWEIYLGVDLFNSMMTNYKNSLERKRNIFCNRENINKKIKNAMGKWANNKTHLNITREILEKLVWEKPSSIIAKQYFVSGGTINKRCKKWGIKKPQRGYWAKTNHGKKHIEKFPLHEERECEKQIGI